MARYGLFVLKVPLNPNQPTIKGQNPSTEKFFGTFLLYDNLQLFAAFIEGYL